MGRNIVSQQKSIELESVGATNETPDNYVAQIVKLIPAEIVGVYLGIQNLLSTLVDPVKAWMQLILFLIILAITPSYLKRIAGITDPNQRMVSLISYVIWAISLGGPFAYFLTYVKSPVTAEIIGGLLIMLYTLFVPTFFSPATPKE